MKHIHRCCDCSTYTLKDTCKCGGDAVTIKPPKYSPDDKYAGYRRKVKTESWRKEGLI